MTIVTLKDGTTYYIDTNIEYEAREVVKYKLRDRLDFREIQSLSILDDLSIDPNSAYYNSSNRYDRKKLKAKIGWSYKWN